MEVTHPLHIVATTHRNCFSRSLPPSSAETLSLYFQPTALMTHMNRAAGGKGCVCGKIQQCGMCAGWSHRRTWMWVWVCTHTLHCTHGSHLEDAWYFCPVMLLSEVIDAVPGRAGKHRGGWADKRCGNKNSMTYCSPFSFLPHPTTLTPLYSGTKTEVLASPKPLFSKHKPQLSIPVSPTTATHNLCPATSHPPMNRLKRKGCCHCSAPLSFSLELPGLKSSVCFLVCIFIDIYFHTTFMLRENHNRKSFRSIQLQTLPRAKWIDKRSSSSLPFHSPPVLSALLCARPWLERHDKFKCCTPSVLRHRLRLLVIQDSLSRFSLCHVSVTLCLLAFTLYFIPSTSRLFLSLAFNLTFFHCFPAMFQSPLDFS